MSGERWLEHRVEAALDGRTVRDVLLRSLRLSKQMVRRLVRSGGILLDGAPPFLSSPVREGDVVRVRLSAAEPAGLRPVPMPLEVVHEDDDLLVIDKPAGLLVHPTRLSHVRTLAHGVLAHLSSQGVAARPHPVNRLDRDTSGLVLFARHSVAHQRLDRQLRAGTLRRSYRAVVHGAVQADEGVVDAPLLPDPADAHLRVAGTGGAAAVTRFRVAERLHGATLVDLELETGRTHQIRVHMAHLGHPLVGDAAYGGEPVAGCARQALHAWRLALLHPFGGEPMCWEAPLPADLRVLLDALRGEWTGGG